MNQQVHKLLLDIKNKVERSKGVTIESPLEELSAVAKELGLLEMIEINHPSKLMTEDRRVEVPQLDGTIKVMTYTRSWRQLMTPDEIAEENARASEAYALNVLKNSPEKLDAFLDKLGAKPKKTKRAKTIKSKVKGAKKTNDK